MNKYLDILNKKHKKNIVLIGHMGSGKSTVGRILARKLNWQFFDSDKVIEQNEKSKIYKIFKLKGEDHFRKLEKNCISYLLNKNCCVVALGGGSINSKEIRNLLKKKTLSIFLKVDIDILIKRLENKKNRPLLLNIDTEEKIRSLNIERLKFYKQADITINNSEDVKKTINKIIRILN